jgi:RNA polymerase sigma-70 factor (ECF subfamily)
VKVDDLDRLYAALSGLLVRIVRRKVHAPDALIDDACQVAWARLLRGAERVRSECVLAWLIQTATREAVRQLRRERRQVPLEDAPDLMGALTAGPELLFEQRERLASLTQLPERQQRMLWLQGFGLSYEDIAEHTGCTTRTVERQLMRAKGTLRVAA